MDITKNIIYIHNIFIYNNRLCHMNKRKCGIILPLYIVIVNVISIWWSPFIPSRNLNEVFTYNHICL